jgi:hypothetical protein
VGYAFSDTHYSMLRFLADDIHAVPASDLFQEFLKPESELVTRVTRGDDGDNVLDLVIDADYDGNLAGS